MDTTLDILILTLDAPLMSFGGPIVDNFNIIHEYPTQSMMTGLIANALGYTHAQADRLDKLQRRLSYGARQDKPGRLLRDYHTVDLGQPAMRDELAWTTRHRLDPRAGGNSDGTHIRYRDYWADALYIVALTLHQDDDAAAPSLDDLALAFQRPARPLYLGRKTCLPASPLYSHRTRACSLYEALCQTPLHPRASAPRVKAWWPDRSEHAQTSAWIIDQRDWRTQLHQGQRLLHHNLIQPQPAGVLHG